MRRGDRGGKKEKRRRQKQRRRQIQQKLDFLKNQAFEWGCSLTKNQIKSAIRQLQRNPSLPVLRILKSFNLQQPTKERE